MGCHGHLSQLKQHMMWLVWVGCVGLFLLFFVWLLVTGHFILHVSKRSYYDCNDSLLMASDGLKFFFFWACGLFGVFWYVLGLLPLCCWGSSLFQPCLHFHSFSMHLYGYRLGCTIFLFCQFSFHTRTVPQCINGLSRGKKIVWISTWRKPIGRKKTRKDRCPKWNQLPSLT